ncbi:MAG: hypothetical protein L6271_12255 [Desulfobacteraceae bacterium]|nr:hypothetical protein [Desulfobacteraceae bacterium]
MVHLYTTGNKGDNLLDARDKSAKKNAFSTMDVQEMFCIFNMVDLEEPEATFQPLGAILSPKIVVYIISDDCS